MIAKIFKIAAQLLIAVTLFSQAEAKQNCQISGAELWKQSEQFYTSCIAQCKKIGLDEETAYFYQKLGSVNLELGKFSNALEYIEKALVIYNTLEPSLVTTRLNIVDAQILKARLLGFLDRYAEAVEKLLIAYRENCAIRGEDDLETIRLYKHLGWHLGRLGNCGGSLQDLKNCDFELNTIRLHLGELDSTQETPFTVLFLAQKCYEKALSADKKILGEWHPDTAKSYSLIGWILGDQGNYLEALEYHRKALEIRLKCYSELHPDTARSYSHIGWNYEKLGNSQKAREYYEMAVRIKVQTLPEGHPSLEEDKINLDRVQK